MSQYWISHTLEDNLKYPARYAALIAEIKASSTSRWDETTSFHLVESSLSIDALAAKLKNAIDPSTDTILIRYVGHRSARYIGRIIDLKKLLTFLPYAARA